MYIARILYPVEVLGYGKRIGIWFDGCPHRCKGCSNPELQVTDEKYNIDIENVFDLVLKITQSNPVDGFTLTGGEPFFQLESLDILTRKLSRISGDILIYTGYTLKELHEMKSQTVENILSRISVLIDGRYIEELNNNCPMRGSQNQKVHILSEKYRKVYNDCMKRENKIQNFMSGNSIISVGIHKKNFDF